MTMAGVYADELAEYDQDFAGAQEPNAPLPDGTYAAMVDDAYIVRGTKDPSALFLKAEMTVVDGDEAGHGTSIFQQVNHPDPKRMAIAKRLVRSLGYEEPGLRGLEGFLEALAGRIYQIQVKTNDKGYSNTFVQRRLESSAYADDTPPHGDEDAPF